MKLETAGDDAARMQDAAKRLISSCAQCYTCHCTGLPQYALMKEAMGARLSYLAGGDVIEL